MNISIFGLGYVGCVGLGCLAQSGHNVIGIDVTETKVDLINSGHATIVEKDIDEMIQRGQKEGRIIATLNSHKSVINSEIAIICVGTPNNEFGHLNMEYIEKVSAQIGAALKDKKEFFTIALRSTVIPGTNKKVGEIIANTSGKKNNIDFAVVSNPEFLREGTAVDDYFNPPYTVVASESNKAVEVMRKVYKSVQGEFIRIDIGSAELIKFVNNSFHALKVAFTNEIGRICKSLHVDSHDLMDLFVKDKILNISPYYLKPGFAYGGSCLPKDLKSLNTLAHDNYLEVPILSSIDNSNRFHIDFAYNIIAERNIRKIGFYNISFKPGTDDLRFSPALELVERFLGKGFKVSIYDKNVNLSKLTGKNKEYLFDKLPHIEEILLDNMSTFIECNDLVIISNADEEVNELLSGNVEIIDLAHVTDKGDVFENYEGLCW
jgi:GDP-mannose 6-dehydrogenase